MNIQTYEIIKSTKGGFMFTYNENINQIMLQIANNYNGHSGASLACTLRSCQYYLSNLYEWNQIMTEFN